MGKVEDVKRMVCELAKVDESNVTPTSNLAADLMMDELDIMELVMMLEEEYCIEIDDNDIDKLTTISAIVEYLEGECCT